MKKLKDYKSGCDAINLLRDSLEFFDNRPEFLNEHKSVNQLLNEFLQQGK